MTIKKTKLALTGALVAGVAALTGVGSLALFTDSQDVGANAFAAGTVDIGSTVTTDLVSFGDMMPGDVITDSLVVSNAANGESFRYSLTSSATNGDNKGLKDQLVLTVKTGDSGAPTACAAFTGTQLYTGDLDSAVGGVIIGSTVQGNQAGDRTLAQGATETLCFRVSLPGATGNAFQGAATTATFSFFAEQTANNP